MRITGQNHRMLYLMSRMCISYLKEKKSASIKITIRLLASYDYNHLFLEERILDGSESERIFKGYMNN